MFELGFEDGMYIVWAVTVVLAVSAGFHFGKASKNKRRP